jgi:hypothetical protein
MKPMVLPLALAVAMMASPGDSQTPPEAEAPGVDLMEEGARLLFRGLMREMEPALTEMGKALSEMEPALTELMALIDDIRNYDAPRVLENGDILIPRRTDVPPRSDAPDPPAIPPDGEIEL